jgi:hypothetical protein
METILRDRHATDSEPYSARLRMGWTTWWLWRGARTRSHPELGRENPQRPWYCVSRHGRVGRRQVFQPIRHRPRHNHRVRPGGDRQPGGVAISAGWSSPVARQAHNLKAAGSNPAPATNDPIILPEPPFSSPGAAVLARFGSKIDAPGPPSAKYRNAAEVAPQFQANLTTPFPPPCQ